MQAGAWLALPVTAAILVGMVWPLSGRARRAQLFATGAVLLYLAALLHIYFILPTHAAVKASYTLGLTPCYGLLAAAGFRPLLGNRWLHAAVYGLLACFGAAAYAAYFVL
jgi:hypothetical protein